MLANYLRLMVFAFGLLAGIQVPGFVDQYAKRVSAHEIEAVRALSGFQETANKYFDGSLEALITHHATSTDSAFQSEAKNIQQLYDRARALKVELAALSGSLLGRILHVAFRPDREILGETRTEYSYTVPLDPPAIVSGILIGALLAMLVDALVGLIAFTFGPPRQRAHHLRAR